MGKALRQGIQLAELTTEDIDLFIPHQADARIIQSAAPYAGMRDNKIFLNIQKHRTTSAASIPIALTEALEEGVPLLDLHWRSSFGQGLTLPKLEIQKMRECWCKLKGNPPIYWGGL